ncbi:M50 family metallopeptidase [Methylocystis heyeri]|nr:site-2 protease family protein [Methylocystis heyeri]
MDLLMTLLVYILPFVIVLSIIVFVHEYGHFIVGRLCGIKVDAFSLGFGPEICAFDDRKGTRWRIAAIPLGGYVKFHGDANGASMSDAESVAAMPAEERAVTFFAQPVWKRAATVFAGPAFNFIFAIAIFAGVFLAFGRPVLVNGEPVATPRISAVDAGRAGARAGFLPGDLVQTIDGQTIESFFRLQQVVAASAGKELRFVVLRNGAETSLTATPDLVEADTPKGKAKLGRLGLKSSEDFRDMLVEPCSAPEALEMALEKTWSIVETTGRFFAGVVTGRESPANLSGPIGIAEASGRVAQKIPTLGLWPMINWIALLSVSVGLLNLMPVPLLDGGHLMFFVIEALRGRALNDRVQEYAFRIGLATVGSLMLFATYNDLARGLRRLVGGGS